VTLTFLIFGQISASTPAAKVNLIGKVEADHMDDNFRQKLPEDHGTITERGGEMVELMSAGEQGAHAYSSFCTSDSRGSDSHRWDWPESEMF